MTQLKNNQPLGIQSRASTLRDAKPDEADERSITLSFSSEEQVTLWFGLEVLSHDPGCANLARLNNAAPLLFNHDVDDLLGVVEKAWIGADKRGYATVRFGQDERGEWARKQVADGILLNVSVTYRVHKYIAHSDDELHTAIDWEPIEISLVTIPADQSVGVGRSAAPQEHPVTIEQRTPAITPEEPKMPEATTTEEPKPTADQILAGERSRTKEIDAMCRSHNIPAEKREKMISDGTSIDLARGLILEEIGSRGEGQLTNSGYAPDLSDKEQRSYSMISAINATLSRDWKKAGLELEISNDIAQRTGKDSAGFYMPTNLGKAGWTAKRDAYATGGTPGQGSTGGTLVQQGLLAGDFIEVLRNKARVIQAGARVLSGLVGNVTIPRQATQGNTFWVTEGQPIGESEATFDSITLAPRTIGTLSLITRNMLLQSTPDIEMLVRADFIATIALGIDLAVLSGAGGASPTGISGTANINTVVGGTNGAALTIGHLIAMEAALADSNAPEETLAYLGNAKTIGALKSLVSTTGQYLWTNSPIGSRSGTPGEINGYPMMRSNQARKNLTKGTQDGTTAAKSCSELFFGAWSEVIIGEWGVLEILPNPYGAGYKSGGVELRVLQTIDTALRHPQSFTYMADAIVLP